MGYANKGNGIGSGGSVGTNSVGNTQLASDVKIGSLANVQTTNKSDVVSSINEVNSNLYKMKATSADTTAGYLSDKVDNLTVQVVGNKVIAKTLDGLTATIGELNYVNGVTSAVQTQINNISTNVSALSNGMKWQPSVATKADLLALTTNTNGDTRVVTADESQGNARTLYVYNAGWVYIGVFTFVNDATTTTKGIIQLAGGTAANPVVYDSQNLGGHPPTYYASQTDLSSVSGGATGKADKVVSAVNGDFAGLDVNGNLTDSGKKASDFATASAFTTHTGDTTAHITATERTNWNDAYSKEHTHSNKTLLDSYTNTNTAISQAITDDHTHSNKTSLDKLAVDTNNNLTINGTVYPTGSTGTTYTPDTFLGTFSGSITSATSQVPIAKKTGTLSIDAHNGVILKANKQYQITAFLYVDTNQAYFRYGLSSTYASFTQIPNSTLGVAMTVTSVQQFNSVAASALFTPTVDTPIYCVGANDKSAYNPNANPNDGYIQIQEVSQAVVQASNAIINDGAAPSSTSLYSSSKIDTTYAHQGANSDITSISGLTTALSVPQGGTGATTKTAARANLGCNGITATTIADNATVLATSAVGNNILSYSFTTNGGTVIFNGKFTAFATVAITNGIAFTMYIDGGTGHTVEGHFNTANVHLSIPFSFIKTGLAAGTHTLTMANPGSNVNTNSYDVADLTMLEII